MPSPRFAVAEFPISVFPWLSKSRLIPAKFRSVVLRDTVFPLASERLMPRSPLSLAVLAVMVFSSAPPPRPIPTTAFWLAVLRATVFAKAPPARTIPAFPFRLAVFRDKVFSRESTWNKMPRLPFWLAVLSVTVVPIAFSPRMPVSFCVSVRLLSLLSRV